ncbi:MAG: hypothetical protein L6R43_01660 [Planctomycetes bacterium]|nr:hypothetical protein [Planctomycetota bacterium]
MTRTILSSALLALAASAALAVGSTGRLDDLSTAAGDARSALADAVSKEDLRTRKSLDRLLAALDRIPGDAGLASELKGASKAAGLVEGRLAAVEGLAGPLAAAAEGYGEDVLALRGIVEDVLGGGSLEGKALAAAEKRLVLVDRFLAKAAASATRRRELAALAAAARHAAAVPDDGSGGDLSASWVLSALSLAPAGTGHDFDGNGTPNNALGSMLALLGSFGLGDAGASVDAALAAALADGSLLLAVEMWDVRSFSGDPSVTAGFEAVSDTDGDPPPRRTAARCCGPRAPSHRAGTTTSRSTSRNCPSASGPWTSRARSTSRGPPHPPRTRGSSPSPSPRRSRSSSRSSSSRRTRTRSTGWRPSSDSSPTWTPTGTGRRTPSPAPWSSTRSPAPWRCRRSRAAPGPQDRAGVPSPRSASRIPAPSTAKEKSAVTPPQNQ